VLGLEGILFLDRVGRDPDDRDAGLGKGRLEAGKVFGFNGAARRVGLGVEIQDELLPLEVAELYGAATIPCKPEVRGLGALGGICRHVPSFRRFPSVL